MARTSEWMEELGRALAGRLETGAGVSAPELERLVGVLEAAQREQLPEPPVAGTGSPAAGAPARAGEASAPAVQTRAATSV